jgi:hypothetical protein
MFLFPMSSCDLSILVVLSEILILCIVMCRLDVCILIMCCYLILRSMVVSVSDHAELTVYMLLFAFLCVCVCVCACVLPSCDLVCVSLVGIMFIYDVEYRIFKV